MARNMMIDRIDSGTPPDDARPLAGMRCLVLDDEFLIALDVQQVLETAGAKSVTCLINAADALQLILRHPPFSLAVLEIGLGRDFDTDMAVAAALERRGTPFVFLTSVVNHDLRTQRFPAVPVVEKPFRAEILLGALRRALAAHRRAR